MKTIATILAEDKKEDDIQMILRLWAKGSDIEKIAETANKTVDQIKKILKKAGKKGFE
jgi:uncharacterized spore protein YtfJ